MAEEAGEVLYGIGTMQEVKKKMERTLAKSHDLNSEMLTELMDTVQTGIEAYATQPNMTELATKMIK